MTTDIYAASLMSANLVKTKPERSVDKVVEKMNKHNINSVVVEGEDYLGIFTTSDLVCAIDSNNKPVEKLSVVECATENPVSVNPTSDLQTVLQILFKENFHHVLVESEGKLCGIISTSDVVDYVSLIDHKI